VSAISIRHETWLNRCVAFLLENWYNSKKDQVDALKEKSTRLKQNVDLAITVDIKEQQLRADRERTLNRIKPPAGSSFDPDPKNCCMPDTRTDVIESLVSFALSEDTSPRLFLLSGVAGSGKSAVATSVTNALHQRGRLSGSFFFKRDIERLRVPANLVHTVAYSIARQYKPYMDVLIDVLNSNPTIEDAALSIQFETLLKKPLHDVSNVSSTTTAHASSKLPSVTFIIDALDECDDSQTISSYLAGLVSLAPWLKVIVTSRPMDESEAELRGSGNMTHLNLFAVDASEDIVKFTQSRFAPGGLLHRLRSRVTEEEIQALADKSHGLFIWIKTVLSYIASLVYDGAKLKEMRSILSSSKAASPRRELTNYTCGCYVKSRESHQIIRTLSKTSSGSYM
jgi:Mrp family chromosome partitioning ATPase